MTPTRSGWMPLLLLYRSPQFWAVRGEFFFFNILLGFAPLLALLVVCSLRGGEAVVSSVDPNDAIHRLARPLSADDRKRHLVRVSGHAHGGEAQRGVCLVITEDHGKNGWSEKTRSTFGDGVSLDTANGERIEVDWHAARWAPDPDLEIVSGPREAFWRERLSSYGSRIKEACLRHTALFVSGCRDSKGVVQSCPRDGLVVTPGDGTPQPRIDARAAKLAGDGSLLGVALAAVLFYVYWSVLRGRPLATALLRNTPAPLARPAPWMITAAFPLLVLGVGHLVSEPLDPGGVTVDRDGYAIAAFSLDVALLGALLMRARRRALVAACAPVIDTPTLPLADARAGLVELAVQVDPNAPLGTGPITQVPHAFAALTIWSIVQSGRNHVLESCDDRNPRPLVPVRDASGEGVLDLSSAPTDIRACRLVVRRKPLVPSFDEILGPSNRERVCVLEERFLDRGESLYVLGHVERVEASTSEAGYREARVVPRIAPILVYAGSERSLLFALAVERGYLRVAEIAGWSIAALILAYAVALIMR